MQGPEAGPQGRGLAGGRIVPLAEPFQSQGFEQSLLLLEQDVEGTGPLRRFQVLGPGGAVEGASQQVGGPGQGRGLLRPPAPEGQGCVESGETSPFHHQQPDAIGQPPLLHLIGVERLGVQAHGGEEEQDQASHGPQGTT